MKEIINCIDCLTKEHLQVILENDVIISKKKTDISNVKTDIFIGPGLLDIQVNGFSNVDFNTFPIQEKDFLKVIENLSKKGVLSFFPTIITNSNSLIISLLKNINQLCLNNPIIDSYVAGVHLEGPFISPDEEASGAHNAEYIKAPNWELFKEFQEASGQRIKLITISPEWENSTKFIEKCITNGITVAIGHTVADYKQINAAVTAGASMSTHLGNGAPLSLHRTSNMIYDQLANNKLSASIIADGYHLSDNFLKTVLKMKKGGVILVSDATMFAGMKSGVYHSHIGGKVHLNEGGRLSVYDNNNLLAGSAVSILDCINYLINSNLLGLSVAWSIASTEPNKLMGFSDKNNDYVLFRLTNKSISVVSSFKLGYRVYNV